MTVSPKHKECHFFEQIDLGRLPLSRVHLLVLKLGSKVIERGALDLVSILWRHRDWFWSWCGERVSRVRVCGFCKGGQVSAGGQLTTALTRAPAPALSSHPAWWSVAPCWWPAACPPLVKMQGGAATSLVQLPNHFSLPGVLHSELPTHCNTPGIASNCKFLLLN